MNQLHGDEVDLDEAYVLEYQTQRGSYAIVWISETNLVELPPKLFEDMLEFVENSELYINHHEKEISNRNVQYAFGTERDNYYFATENRLYGWRLLKIRETFLSRTP
ncbi:hypothetical protein H1D32_08315 [Anaerobacillus sp. CMMVII]|uniref:hypothetical protein n=1 Tax=Anaerobacillus sp. CMMVII TaxID=2755588 RepID=UPI0021B76C6D|nr:hypothetical protein [Anaerobacillus sp. CMMVII]MCT8137762.1 hypothetical protein [Anaerobacillus sp. CMMVII]